MYGGGEGRLIHINKQQSYKTGSSLEVISTMGYAREVRLEKKSQGLGERHGVGRQERQAL